MYRILSYVVMFAFLCIFAATTIAAPKPIVYYKFDELGDVISDASGNGNDGTPMGGVILNDNGKLDKCFEFNGTDSYISLDRVIQDDFTIMCWIKTDTPGAAGTQGYQGTGLVWSDVGGVANDFIMAVLGTKLSFFCGNPDLSANSEKDIVTGDWIHIAAVRSATDQKMSIYIDGKEEKSMDHANQNPLDAQALLAVGANTLDSRYYTGLMDEVKLFDAALTEAEVQAVSAPAAVEPKAKLTTSWGVIKANI